MEWTITSGISAFASEVSMANQYISQNTSAGSNYLIETGVYINGVYYTKEQFGASIGYLKNRFIYGESLNV